MRLAVLYLLAFAPVAALADEISGDWCSDAGAHVRIEGHSITTPGGQVTNGLYGRHSFDFVIPEGEADAGLAVQMRQVSEAQVIVTFEGREPEDWHRCQVVS